MAEHNDDPTYKSICEMLANFPVHSPLSPEYLENLLDIQRTAVRLLAFDAGVYDEEGGQMGFGVSDGDTTRSARGDFTCVICAVTEWSEPRPVLNHVPLLKGGALTICEPCLDDLMEWAKGTRNT